MHDVVDGIALNVWKEVLSKLVSLKGDGKIGETGN